MWKYQCKRHVLFIFVGMLIGFLALQNIGKDTVVLMSEMFKDNTEMMEVISSPSFPIVVSILYGGGMVNAFLLIYYISQRYNAMILFLLLLLVNPLMQIVMYVGLLSLIPTIVICIYGMLTLPNRGKHKDFAKQQSNSISEIERVYRLHHSYHEEYEGMAKKIFLTNLGITVVYALGVFALVFILLYVDNFTIMIFAMLAYMVILFGMTKKRNEILRPVMALLYEQCDPEACASVVLALSRKFHAKKNIPLANYLAQSMLYLNDPHLAIDILARSKHTNAATIMPYHALMAEANYLLGDESEVKRHLELLEGIVVKGVNSPLVNTKQQYINGINNDLDLMRKQFASAKEHYRTGLISATYEIQKVEIRYYLGLIAFVEQDYGDARSQFSYVTEHGNKVYYTQKALKFLEMIEQVDS